MLKNHRNSRWTLATAVLLMSVTMAAAYADDDDVGEGEGRSIPYAKHFARAGDNGDENSGGSKKGSLSQVSNAKWKEECGSCHMAYPPGFLSADSWRAMMSGLDKHFGSDASLDAAAASEIGNFLEKNSSTKQRKSSNGIEPPLRISDTSWFKSEHREVSSGMWKNPKVKSPSNCAACHINAESGNFSEHDVRMPK